MPTLNPSWIDDPVINVSLSSILPKSLNARQNLNYDVQKSLERVTTQRVTTQRVTTQRVTTQRVTTQRVTTQRVTTQCCHHSTSHHSMFLRNGFEN